MTRVLHVIKSADPRSGGPIEGALRTGEAWASLGHRHDLMTLDPPGSGFCPDYPGTIFELGMSRGRMPWHRYGYTPGAVAWLRAHAADYDAVIVAGLWNYATMVARLALVHGRTPWLVYTHGMLDPWFKRTYPVKAAGKQVSWWLNEGPLLAGAAAVLFTTEEERRLAQGSFRPYRVRPVVVGYGTADAPAEGDDQQIAFRERCPELAGRRFLLFLSRIHPKKGCDILIEGFARAAVGHSDLHLVIAGPDDGGMAQPLREIAARLGVADRVHFPGMLQGPAKWGAFRACDAFVLTSHQENFGVVVAEAMACGRPVLISDKVNIWREVVETGGGMAEPDTANGAAAVIGRFLGLEDATRAAMGEAARRGFLSRYEIDASAMTLLRVVEDVVASRV